MIRISANSRFAVARCNDPLTTGSVGIETHFIFSKDWAGLSKTAVFSCGGVETPIFLTSDSTTVPPECLTHVGDTLTIGVYGTDGNGVLVIPTVYAEVGKVVQGAEIDAAAADITPSLADQVLAAANGAVSVSNQANENSSEAVERANEALQQAQEALSGAQDAGTRAETSAAAAALSEANADASAVLSESWAVGGTGTRRNEDVNNAEFWARVARYGAENVGYVVFDVNDDDGHMYVTVTENLADDVDFRVNESTGRLEVTVNG